MIDVPYEKLESVYCKKGKICTIFLIRSREGEEICLNWMKKDDSERILKAISDGINATAVEPVSIQKKRGLLWIEMQISVQKSGYL